MHTRPLNSLVGICDYDEASNLSTYLISHGWNADHATSPGEILADLEDGNYALVVLDEEMLNDSEWTLDEYLEEIDPEVTVVVLTPPESRNHSGLAEGNLAFLQHPYSSWDLRSTLAKVSQMGLSEEDGEEDASEGYYEEEDSLYEDDLEPATI
ncbi:MAG: hypothetical protein HUU16_13855 [Candidatus Omnitrophica bacterium]|nr:hypothetical protein [bacterium]NUN97246.1 hypothetical protein [Candidatus Omnitrophota bacterium]